MPCASMGPSPPLNPGGWWEEGGGRCPRLGHPLRSPRPRSCAMAIREELRSGCFWRAVLAEAMATLIFVGVVLGASAAPGPLAPALAGGLAAAALACALGAPQANPALTLALLCTRKLSALRGAAGLLAQCAGAVLASAAARSALPDDASLVTRVSAAGTAGQAWGWETFATFQLALAAFATADRAAGPTGLALGSAVAAGALAAGPFSGGSMNPARSLGPAVVTGIWDDHWVSRWHPWVSCPVPPSSRHRCGLGAPGCSVELPRPILPPGQGALLLPSAAPPAWVLLVPPPQDGSPPVPSLGVGPSWCPHPKRVTPLRALTPRAGPSSQPPSLVCPPPPHCPYP
ncbi:aquaporin-2-like isoform X1 [Anser cygnoides]|uniref:aquaporin-2-like isoform X1 n=1 Tax=Anser cygnoides TaxID=8845 RepID=UPI0034D1AAD5